MWTLVDQKEIHIDLKKGDMGKQPVWEAIFEGQREVTPFRGMKDVIEADEDPQRYDDLDPETQRIVRKLRVCCLKYPLIVLERSNEKSSRFAWYQLG